MSHCTPAAKRGTRTSPAADGAWPDRRSKVSACRRRGGVGAHPVTCGVEDAKEETTKTAAFAGISTNWRKPSAGPAAGQAASTASAPAAKCRGIILPGVSHAGNPGAPLRATFLSPCRPEQRKPVRRGLFRKRWREWLVVAPLLRRMRPRATSSMVSATAQLCDSTKAMRMRICTAPACAAEPVLSSTPTNAPGRVTRPTVRV